MISYFILCLLYVLSNGRVTDQFNCPYPGNFLDNNSISSTKYITCKYDNSGNLKPEILYCDKYEVFDSDLKICTRIYNELKTSRMLTKSIDFECHSDGSFPDDSHDCTGYYVCKGSEAVHKTCPPGELFDADLAICVDAKEYECPNTGKPTTTSTTEKPTTTPKPEESTTTLEPTTTTEKSITTTTTEKPITTTEETTTTAGTEEQTTTDGQTTTEGLTTTQGSTTNEVPTTTEGSTTTDETTTSTEQSSTTQSTTTSAPPYTCRKDGLFEDSKNCNKYFHCITKGDGDFYLLHLTCPYKLVFNPSRQHCVTTNDYKCKT